MKREDSEWEELVKDAYLEGFQDGSSEATQYDWGSFADDAKVCWKRSDIKEELDNQ